MIYDKTKTLACLETCVHIKKLTNHRYDYRMRVGRYRILFNHDQMVEIVSIEEVKKRDDNTY